MMYQKLYTNIVWFKAEHAEVHSATRRCVIFKRKTKLCELLAITKVCFLRRVNVPYSATVELN